MAICAVCGNDYDKSFELTYLNETYVFDCFECAIYKLAPKCSCCGCKIIGHGLEADNNYYCCRHCSYISGIDKLVDHV